MPKKNPKTSIPALDQVQQRILLFRGERVILAADLATLYGVATRRLNEQVKRNANRFPEDFMFRLSREEAAGLNSQSAASSSAQPPSRSQIATLKRGSNIKYLPYAFTEHGAIMAATVLNSPQAVQASLFVVRAFVRLRQLLSTHQHLAAKLAELEHKLENHDSHIQEIINALRQLMDDPEEPTDKKPPVGFQTELVNTKALSSQKKRGHHLP